MNEGFMDKKKIMELARKIYSSGIAACQNAEAGHEKASYKHQDACQAALIELAEYLGEEPFRD